jgi:hypothetical protein
MAVAEGDRPVLVVSEAGKDGYTGAGSRYAAALVSIARAASGRYAGACGLRVGGTGDD